MNSATLFVLFLCLSNVYSKSVEDIERDEMCPISIMPCPLGEIYTKCMRCIQNCGTKLYCSIRPYPCKPGCICPPDYFRNSTNQCVHYTLCDQASTCGELKSATVEYTCRINGRTIPCIGRIPPNTIASPKCKPYHSSSSLSVIQCSGGKWTEDKPTCTPDSDGQRHLDKVCSKEDSPCPVGEIYTRCNRCVQNCGSPIYCRKSRGNCEPGCICPPDKFRNFEKKCIDSELCDRSLVCDAFESDSVDFKCKYRDRNISCIGALIAETIVTPKCKPWYHSESQLEPFECDNGQWTLPIPECFPDVIINKPEVMCSKEDLVCPIGEVYTSCKRCIQECGKPLICKDTKDDCEPGCACPAHKLRNSTNQCSLIASCNL